MPSRLGDAYTDLVAAAILWNKIGLTGCEVEHKSQYVMINFASFG